METVNIGFGDIVLAGRMVAIVAPTSMSVKRMRSISIRPPQYPATIPISVPTVLIKRTTMMVMESDTRAP